MPASNLWAVTWVSPLRVTCTPSHKLVCMYRRWQAALLVHHDLTEVKLLLKLAIAVGHMHARS